MSWTHGYHAVALLPVALGAGFREAIVTAHAFDTLIVESLSRDGWPEEATITSATRTIAVLDFGGRTPRSTLSPRWVPAVVMRQVSAA